MTSNLTGWNQVPENVVTDKIPPGWSGRSSETTFEQWQKDCNNWQNICSYETVEARISAICFRLPKDIKEFAEEIGKPPATISQVGTDGNTTNVTNTETHWNYFWIVLGSIGGHVGIIWESS